MVTVTAMIAVCLFVVVSAAPTRNPVCDEPQPEASCALDDQPIKKWQWHYAQDLDDCVAFIYGGCRGSSNNFETKEECDAACRSQEGSEQVGQLVATGTQTTTKTSTTTAKSTTTGRVGGPQAD